MEPKQYKRTRRQARLRGSDHAGKAPLYAAVARPKEQRVSATIDLGFATTIYGVDGRGNMVEIGAGGMADGRFPTPCGPTEH